SRVPAGHLWTFGSNSTSASRYWDPSRSMTWLTEAELELFDQTFERAVDRCLPRTGRSAIFLSGGFDSVSVAAVAADLSSRRGATGPHALSLAFPADEPEWFIQRSVARDLHLSQDFVPFD